MHGDLDVTNLSAARLGCCECDLLKKRERARQMLEHVAVHDDIRRELLEMHTGIE